MPKANAGKKLYSQGTLVGTQKDKPIAFDFIFSLSAL